MSIIEDRFMWLFVMFDLPTKTSVDKSNASKFRKSLIKDGFIMLQFSVYARICKGLARAEKHIERVKFFLPPEGSIKVLKVTDMQYANMMHFIGPKLKKNIKKNKENNQGLLFF